MQDQQLASAILVFDIDGVVRDVGGSYRRALADTVEHFTAGAYRPTSADIDNLKSEGVWNNDWECSQELVFRYFETQGQPRSSASALALSHLQLDYQALVTFFQSRYRGSNPNHWTGYICHEPLLLQPSYLQQLSAAGIYWGFFSGATRASAIYVLTTRLGLHSPILIAMEDAPGKPDPTGLLATVKQIEQQHQIDSSTPVLYAGDTVADMYTVQRARSLHPNRHWIGVGILPPHVQETPARRDAYAETLKASGASTILSNIEQLDSIQIQELIWSKS